ncbi:MAG: recombinase family protein [Clostridia bacterium]|nr:recombinase family protein [Clostridia bacterium]
MNACAYIRVSTEDQTEYSPHAQLNAIKKYCKEKGYTLLDEYIYSDEGKSGRVAEKRPAFMKMIADAKKNPKPFDVILVHKFDRFARNRTDSAVYKSILQKECKISVVSVTETIDNSKISIIMESMLDALAEYYSINLSEEVKKGMTQKVLRGEPLTIAPFGYKMLNKKLIPNNEETIYVKYLFDEFIQGKSYRKLAEDLNQKGIVTHKGNKFETRTIEYILRNPVYCGYIRWNPTERTRRNYDHPDILIVKGEHTPIISRDIYIASLNRIDELKRLNAPYSKNNIKKSHPLSGLIRCGECGATMVNSNGYFVCSGYVRGKCQPRNSIRADIIYKHIIKKISNDFNYKYTYGFCKRETADNNYEKIKQLEIKLSRAKEAYLNGVDTLEEYTQNKSKIISEIKSEKKTSSFPTMLSKPVYCANLSFLELIKNGDGNRFIKSIKFSKLKGEISITYIIY